MSAAQASKRARPPALDAAVSTLAVPGLVLPRGLFVLADGNRLVSTAEDTLQLLTPSGFRVLLAGSNEEEEESASIEEMVFRVKVMIKRAARSVCNEEYRQHHKRGSAS